MEDAVISGIALDKNQARITIRNVEDRPGVAAEIFSALASKEINVDMIVQNIGRNGETNLGFTVPQNELETAYRVMKEVNPNPNSIIESDADIVKVSLVGVGMKSHSGIASKAFKTLADEGINIQMISTSEIKISMIVEAKYGELAVHALHKAYDLDK